MKDYYTIIIGQKALHATEKYKKTDWVTWCWEYVGIDNFSWTIDLTSYTEYDMDENELHPRAKYVYIIRFKYEEDKLLFILNWI